MSKYDYAVFIGRFSPVHIGHVKVMKEALEQSDYLIVILGSANQARNTRNPFSVKERIRMIELSTDSDPRIIYTHVNDYGNDTLWIAAVQNAVNTAIETHSKNAIFTNTGWRDYNFNIALAGMHKDETSYYLNFLPAFDSIAVMPGSVAGDVHSSTGIRNKLFNGELDYANDIDDKVKKFIHYNVDGQPEIWGRLFRDWDVEKNYESVYGAGPHVTIDNLVIQAGHILLIQRGPSYGENLWAMPGGFLNRRERIITGAIRELREETKLKVPDKVLLGSLKGVKVYDSPFRSNRSHIITHCHKYVLENVSTGLPDVMGADDAKKAKWIPVADVAKMSGTFFEDHEVMITEQLSA